MKTSPETDELLRAQEKWWNENWMRYKDFELFRTSAAACWGYMMIPYELALRSAELYDDVYPPERIPEWDADWLKGFNARLEDPK